MLYRVLGLLLALLMIEGLLQLAALVSPPIALLLSPGIPRSLPDERIGRRPNPALPGHDAEGWRNPEVPARVDVVALGDSQTYGDEVARENAWPLVLGETLGVSTYNMGLSGYGPIEYYLLAPEAIARGPEVLVVGLYSGNDFVDAYAQSIFSGRADELLDGAPMTPDALREIDESGESLSAAWSRARASRRGAWKTLRDRYLRPLESHSKLWGLVRGIEGIVKQKSSGPRGDSLRTDFDKYARQVAELRDEDFYALRGPDAATVLTPAGRAAAVDVDDPRIRHGIWVSLRALAAIRDACADQCDLLVVLIPTKELVFEGQAEAAGVTLPAAYGALLAHEKVLWEAVRSGLERESIAYVDTLADLRRSVDAGRNPYLSDWDGHPNVAGNEVIAQSAARHAILAPLEKP
jgi:hypothetical protein